MGYSAYTSKYLENDVLSRPREWLVPLMYEHLLAQLRRAYSQIQRREIEGKAASLERASAIVIELISALDHEKGGELAGRLAALYAYFGREILAVNTTLDLVRLARMTEMIVGLHESWVAAARVHSPAVSSPLVTSGEGAGARV